MSDATTPSDGPVLTNYRYALLRQDGSGRVARLISFDHQPAANQLPSPTEGPFISIGDADYAEWVANMATRAWKNGALISVPSDAVVPIATATIVQRLSAVGKLRAARIAMKFDVPLEQITDAELELQELWRANATIHSNNPSARAMLDSLDLGSVGSSTDAILAP